MTTYAWPDTLPQCMSGYSEKTEAMTIRTSVEEGPPKVRRRFTKRVTRGRVSMVMDIDQRNRLDDFFVYDLDAGVHRFTFPHPWTQELVEWRMVESPDFANEGALGVNVTMAWELM